MYSCFYTHVKAEDQVNNCGMFTCDSIYGRCGLYKLHKESMYKVTIYYTCTKCVIDVHLTTYIRHGEEKAFCKLKKGF